MNLLDKIMTYTIIVNAGKSVKLEEHSLMKSSVLLYISARRAKAGRKTINGEEIVNDSVFDSSFLTLKQGASTEPIKDLPLSMIDADRFSDSNYMGYPMNLSDIRTNESVINCHADSINKDEVYEITFGYIPNHLC